MSSRRRYNKHPKGYGFDWLSRRLGTTGCQGYGKSVKQRTHQLERLEAKKVARQALLELLGA